MPYQPRVDLDRPVCDRLLLRTVPGAVDYLAEDLRAVVAGDGVRVEVRRRLPDGLVVEYAGPLRPLAASRYFDVAAVPAAEVDRSRAEGVLSALDTGGQPVRFRVGRLGASRWELRDEWAARFGWHNDPAAWDVNVEPYGVEIGALHLTRRHGELARTPASTNPVVAAVLVRLAKIRPGQVVLDPFCGAGTVLVLAGEMARPGRLLGFDHRSRWLSMASGNLAARHLSGTLVRADAGALPLASGSVDRVVANLPFGKRVGSHGVNTALYPAALRELARVLPGGGRAVLLTDDKRLFRETVQRTRLIRIIKEIMLERGGLHPSVYVMTKRGY